MENKYATGNLKWEGTELLQEWLIKKSERCVDGRGITFTHDYEYKDWIKVPRDNAETD